MAISLRITDYSVRSTTLNVSKKNVPFSSHMKFDAFSLNHRRSLCLILHCSDGNAHVASNSQNHSFTHQGSAEDNETGQKKSSSVKEIGKKLRSYGISGILSYGLLNTVYYLTTFLVVWLYVAPAPGKMGFLPAAKRFVKVMAMVWAGSQVTKLARAAGALALAPLVARGLSWFTEKFKFESQGKAFAAIAGFCLTLVVILFLVVTLLWS